MPLHPTVSEPDLGSASIPDLTTIGETQMSNAITHNQNPPSIEMMEKDEAIVISPKEIKLPEQRGTEMTREFQCKYAPAAIGS